MAHDLGDENGEHDQCGEHGAKFGGDAGIALHGVSARAQRAKEHGGTEDPWRIEVSEQGNRNRRVSHAARNSVVDRIGDTGDLDGSRVATERALALAGVGAAFWALVAGLVVRLIVRERVSPSAG